jgi:hypothetical protein
VRKWNIAWTRTSLEVWTLKFFFNIRIRRGLIMIVVKYVSGKSGIKLSSR